MKISFDFGTQKSIDMQAALSTMDYIVQCISSCDVTAAKCTIFLSLYDKDGNSVDLTENGNVVDYLYRAKPYIRPPKGVMREPLEYRVKGIDEPQGYLYKKLS